MPTDKMQLFYVGVKGVIVNHKREALVLYKSDQLGKSFYDIPGGRIAGSDSIIDTLKRELKEEIVNIGDFQVKQLLNAYRLSRDLNDGNGLLLLFYKVEAVLQSVEISNEHNGYLWLKKDELNDLENKGERYIESGYLQALKLALA